ncbi:hypothetical protein [Mycolicibacterium goodii]|uniref:Proline rich protein n=1 Tax=Mycolicibacterium goodii TaxID=134601 RepID=A0ABS6HSC7_MYCGD|nr:hypothetical protein [Mycolicibacterium goodii]MBU8807883.1 hypothetical protein [Mycolicibacterium goodii]MBU8824435.1 hypothetical protein [Mycolicibacterium goodii]MBU8827996.1 hypothetical protein [Mycolicibacterium goodii]MBU8838392.1 hypothetical protein [Mycolicibacterium goodii]ULN47295.1 hypothetical protein MI170_29245 [Mycolicibacterium goodii]
MSETPSDQPTTPVETPRETPGETAVSPTPAPVAVAPRQHSRVVQAAAWVGIVAGVVFIVAVVFGTGFVLGKNSGPGHHHRGHDRPEIMMFHRGGPPPMMPGQFGPGGPGGQFGPGDRGDFRGPSAPERPETPTAPARP